MILTTCAACAAPLTHNAPRCVRCKVRYCKDSILDMQGNLANTLYGLDRNEEALRVRRDVYAGRLKLNGDEHEKTLRAASNLATSLLDLQRLKEAKLLALKMIPVARRVFGEVANSTLIMRQIYAIALWAARRASDAG